MTKIRDGCGQSRGGVIFETLGNSSLSCLQKCCNEFYNEESQLQKSALSVDNISIEIKINRYLCTVDICVSGMSVNSSETARPIGVRLGEGVDLEAGYKVNYF